MTGISSVEEGAIDFGDVLNIDIINIHFYLQYVGWFSETIGLKLFLTPIFG